jgi:hypothetical protein
MDEIAAEPMERIFSVDRNAGRLRILRKIRDVNAFQGKKNCTSCVEVTEDMLSGIPKRQLYAMSDDLINKPGVMESVAKRLIGGTQYQYGEKMIELGSKMSLDRIMRIAGGRGFVMVQWDTGARHVFNVVNFRGHIFYPDAQKGRMFRPEQWQYVTRIWFKRFG